MKKVLREIRAHLRLLVGGSSWKPTVLMYHSIGKNAAHFTVTSDAFRDQMRLLKEKGFEVVPLEDCVRRALAGEKGKIVALTFDDGYRDFVWEALPILKLHQFPATVFLIVGKMGSTYKTSDGEELPLMTWADAGDILRVPGIEVGSHTMTHPKLTKLYAEEQRKELAASREELVRMLGCESGLWFCYPHGRNDETTRSIAREEDYAGAVTIEAGHPNHATDRFGVPRQYVHSEMGMKEFEALFV